MLRPPLRRWPRRRRRPTTDAAILPEDPADDAQDEPERGPLRRCIVTRQQGDRARMIRFVIGPDRALVPDLAATLPGRGIWLSALGDVIETARVRGTFARAARGQVIVPVDLSAVLQAGLSRRIVDFLGLARRAGQAVSGFQKAREWLALGRAALVVQASDGSLDERSRFLSGAGRQVPVMAWLSGAELGRIFGRDHVVHVAIAPGRLAETLVIEAGRLGGLTGRPILQAAAVMARAQDGTQTTGDEGRPDTPADSN